jgi:ATP phosphoribosyltransferase
MAEPQLTIAVPRGALLGETLDLLDALGINTAEIRSNDRKLVFPDAGVITMRPSDVPSYVEHGSADVGITGKDVLREQTERDVYELLDLGFGGCRMIVAAQAGGDAVEQELDFPCVSLHDVPPRAHVRFLSWCPVLVPCLWRF